MRARIGNGGAVRIVTDLAQIRTAIETATPIWVDLERQDADSDELLSEVLHLHSLTIEDVWATRSTPKVEDYENYLYVRIHGVTSATNGGVNLVELDVVIGPSWVITHDPGNQASALAAELDRSPRLLAKGPAWLAHAILDHAVDRFLPVIDGIDAKIEDLENEVLHKAGTRHGPPLLRRILGFKRVLIYLRRIGIHQREILLRLTRGEFDEIPPEAVPYFRDVYDHFLRVTDLVESYRDLVASALEAYLSVQSNRMNDIMKSLALISTVMLPITFVAGVYGMNFKYMPELDYLYGYPGALAVMVAIVIACFIWFRHKGWIGNRDMDVPEDSGE